MRRVAVYVCARAARVRACVSLRVFARAGWMEGENQCASAPANIVCSHVCVIHACTHAYADEAARVNVERTHSVKSNSLLAGCLFDSLHLLGKVVLVLLFFLLSGSSLLHPRQHLLLVPGALLVLEPSRLVCAPPDLPPGPAASRRRLVAAPSCSTRARRQAAPRTLT